MILSKVIGLFYDNVFSARKNPHDEIINPYTEQLNKGGKKKKRPVLTATQEAESPQNKSGEGSKTSEVIKKLS